MKSTSQVSAILLAAGTSSRMGNANKLLLPIQGKTILQHTAENVSLSRVDEIIAVIGEDAQETQKILQPLNLTVVTNPDYAGGMSTSIRTGIQAVNPHSDAAIILLADQPNLQPQTIDRFVACFARREHKIVAAKFGKIIGNPVLFHRTFFADLLSLSGDVGGRAILKKYARQVTTVKIPSEDVCDVDTPADFAYFKIAVINKT